MPSGAGTQLGPYVIEAAVGAGGMGEVYKARDTRLNRTVAIKTLPAHLKDNPDLRQRFLREAQAVAALEHPHICVLHDIGQHEDLDYLVMEYLEGETLAQRLAKSGPQGPPLRLEDALRYAVEIADALDKAHRQGVFHRDLKPGNIMLTKGGAKLLDFGLAKLKAAAGPVLVESERPTERASLTAQGTILGTLQYMAPAEPFRRTGRGWCLSRQSRPAKHSSGSVRSIRSPRGRRPEPRERRSPSGLRTAASSAFSQWGN